MKNGFFLVLFSIIIVGISCKKEKSTPLPQQYGKFKGVVYDEFNHPINGVLVKLEDGFVTTSTMTASTGAFYLGGIPARQYQVSISKDNYIAQTLSTTIPSDGIDSINVILKAGTAFVKSSQDSIVVNSAAGDIVLNIKSNTSWVASHDANFLKLTQSSTSGDGTLQVKYPADTGRTARADTIIITAGTQKVKIFFRQASPIKLLNYFNGTSLIDDSLFAIFNKPIKVVSINTSITGCLSDNMGYKYINNSTGVKFRYLCATYLGRNFPFTITVKDNDGNTLIQNITFNSYTINRDLKGNIMNHFFSADNKTIWVTTQSPNMIYQLSTEDFSVINQYNLSYAPTKAVINPYNNLLYILTNSQNIYVMDPNTGVPIKKIPITYNDNQGTTFPVNFVSDIGFTSTGYGIVVFPIASTSYGWQVIDSKDGDIFYYTNDYVWNNEDFYEVYNNFDNSKLFMTGLFGSCVLTIFDGSTQTLRRITPPDITRDEFITPNKKNNNIYFGQLYNQFIMDLNMNMSIESYNSVKSYASADFCYITGQESDIYYADDDFFAILNYSNGTTLMQISAPLLRGLMTSIDGKYLIMHNGSVIFQFSTKMFNN